MNDTSSIFPGIPGVDAKILTSLLIDVIIGLALCVAFLFMKKRVPEIYEARCDGRDGSPSTPFGGIFGWLRSAVRYNDDLWLLKNRGLDAVIYLMIVRHCFFAMFPITILEFLVLVPVYASSTSSINGTTGLTTISLGNVGEVERFWAPMMVAIVNSIWCFLVFYRLYYQVTAKRIQHRSLRRIENYTVLLREIPRNATAASIGDQIDCLVGRNQVTSVVIALHSRKLPRLFAQRAHALRELERCLALNERSPGTRVRVWRGSRLLARLLSCFSKRLSFEDGETYWRAQMQSIDEAIKIAQGKQRSGCGVAFVTMRSIRAAQLMWQSIVHGGDFNSGSLVPWPWVSEAPPPPSSIDYNRLHVTAKERFIRLVAADFINLVVGLALYVPIAFLVTISSSSYGSLEGVPLVGALFALVPALEGIVRGFLPSIGVSICAILMLHLVLVQVAKLIGWLDLPSQSKSIIYRFFLYMLFVTLLGATVGSSLIQVLRAFIETPSEAIFIIAQSIPRQSTFFINYIMLIAFMDPMFNLLLPVELCWRWFARRFLCISKRDFREQDGPWYFGLYLTSWPLVVFLICMAYSIISPLILIFGCFYYAGMYYSILYQKVFVFTEHASSDGFIFPSMFACLVWSIIVFQLITFSMLALNKFVFAPILLAVSVLTLGAFLLVQYQFTDIAKFGALSQEPENADAIPPPSEYVQPWMLPPKERAEGQKEGDAQHITSEHEAVWGGLDEISRFRMARKQTTVVRREPLQKPRSPSRSGPYMTNVLKLSADHRLRGPLTPSMRRNHVRGQSLEANLPLAGETSSDDDEGVEPANLDEVLNPSNFFVINRRATQASPVRPEWRPRSPVKSIPLLAESYEAISLLDGGSSRMEEVVITPRPQRAEWAQAPEVSPRSVKATTFEKISMEEGEVDLEVVRPDANGTAFVDSRQRGELIVGSLRVARPNEPASRGSDKSSIQPLEPENESLEELSL